MVNETIGITKKVKDNNTVYKEVAGPQKSQIFSIKLFSF